MYADPSGYGRHLPSPFPFHLPVRMHEDIFEHMHVSEEARQRVAQYIHDQDTLELTTVGIDVGSSTSHLLFAKIYLQRETQRLSSRFVVVRREVVWRSPIMFTPFTANGRIDAHELGHFFAHCYEDAGFRPEDVDTGAVILTGEAIKKRNAASIDHLFAGQSGKFVCATAGHQLEATLAAHGSGAVALSKELKSCLLHVDVGGGTTKLALIDNGSILSVSAFAVGGRLLARDDKGAWTRVDDSARLAAEDLGLQTDAESLERSEVREQIAKRLASVAMDYILDNPRDELGKKLLLTDELARTKKPTAFTFSGGVSEYVFGRETADHGDIAALIAGEIREGLSRQKIPSIDPGNGIRATVIGASQFTVQVSGKTIFLSDQSVLPLRNVPVIHFRIPEKIEPDAIVAAVKSSMVRSDLKPDALVALAFQWTRDPDYHHLVDLCRGIKSSMSNGAVRRPPLVILVDGDVGKTIGHLLHEELSMDCEVISIDGVELHELDFVDVGELQTPPGVVPLVIKSLLFS